MEGIVNVAQVMDDVYEEICRARHKFPSNEDQMMALTEEVGELAQALIDHKRGDNTNSDVYDEAVQVACMAIRVACEGDRAYPYNPVKGASYRL